MRTWMLVFGLSAGCGSEEEDTATEGLTISDVSATVSESITTVVTVNWTTSEATQGYVAFGENLRYTTPLTAMSTIVVVMPLRFSRSDSS